MGGNAPLHTSDTHAALARLVSLACVKHAKSPPGFGCISYKERKAEELAQSGPHSLAKQSLTTFIRAYPKASRILSTNLEAPHVLWAALGAVMKPAAGLAGKVGPGERSAAEL